MNSKIIRLNIDHYNNTSRSYPLSLSSTMNRSIVEKLDDYEVVVEKLEVPVNGETMPINNDQIAYKIGIFNELKNIDLPYGFHLYSFNGPYYSVQQFLDKVNTIVQKNLSEYGNFGQFVLNNDNMIEFIRNSESDAASENFKIYFDERLTQLLTFNYDKTDFIDYEDSRVFRLKIINGPASTPYSIIHTIQQTKTFPLFFTLKSIRVYTDLPTESYFIFNMAEKTLVDSNLLTEIIYNSMENYQERNLIYIPSVFRHTSLNTANSLRNLKLDFRYKYANGDEFNMQIEPYQYASITIAFYPINEKDIII